MRRRCRHISASSFDRFSWSDPRPAHVLHRSRFRSSRVFPRTSRLPFVPGLSSCIIFWLRLGCRASQPVITSLAEWSIRGGVLPLGPSSTGISSSGGGLLTKVVTRAAACCRRRCIVCSSARHNVRCFRTHRKPPSGNTVSKPVFTGAMILPPRNSHGFVARVSPSTACTIYLPKCLNFWAWLSRPLS